MNFFQSIAVGILFLFSLPSQAPFNPIDLEAGLIAHYDFNDCDATDLTGNGSDGRLEGNVSCWCGIEDDGLLFDGTKGFVEFDGPVNRAFGTTDFTISFYFKPESMSIFRQSLLGKRSECSEDFMFDTFLDLQNEEIFTRVHQSETKYYPNLSPAYEMAGWHHMVLVREGIRAYTYLDGEMVQRGTRCSGVDITNDAKLSFSNSPCVGEGARRFKGILDELRVYERALNPEEVRALYLLNPIENANSDCYT